MGARSSMLRTGSAICHPTSESAPWTPGRAGAYFLNPEVRQAIGYPGQQAVPIVPEDPPDYEQDGLLASVIARGLIYRPTP